MSSFGSVATIDLYSPAFQRLLKCAGPGLQPPIGASPGELRLWLKLNGLLDDSMKRTDQHMRSKALRCQQPPLGYRRKMNARRLPPIEHANDLQEAPAPLRAKHPNAMNIRAPRTRMHIATKQKNLPVPSNDTTAVDEGAYRSGVEVVVDGEVKAVAIAPFESAAESEGRAKAAAAVADPNAKAANGDIEAHASAKVAVEVEDEAVIAANNTVKRNSEDGPPESEVMADAASLRNANIAEEMDNDAEGEHNKSALIPLPGASGKVNPESTIEDEIEELAAVEI